MAIKPEDPNKPKWKPALQNEVKTECWTKYIVYSNSSCNFKQTKNFRVLAVWRFISCVWSQCISHESPVTSLHIVMWSKKWISNQKQTNKITYKCKKWYEWKSWKTRAWVQPSAKINYFCSSAVNSTLCSKYIVFHNKIFNFVPHVTLSFFMSSFNLLLFYLLWAKVASWSNSYTAKVSLAKMPAKIPDTAWNKWKRFWPHSLQQVRWDHLYTHQFFCSVNTMESLWPTVNLLLSGHLGECWSIIPGEHADTCVF